MSVVLMYSCEGKKLNVFTVSKHKELGLKIKEQLASDPNIKIISSAEAPRAYQMLIDITQYIKNSGKLEYKDLFAWEVYIETFARQSRLGCFLSGGFEDLGSIFGVL